MGKVGSGPLYMRVHIKIHETDMKNVLEKDGSTIEVLSDESSDLEVIGKYVLVNT